MRWRLISSFFPRRGDWREDISAYLDDELSPRERTRVEMSLARSAEMREYLADLQHMRTVLRSLEPAPSAAPFQLTPEMLSDPARIAVRPSSTTRALRLSISTAAVGAATFAAVMVFDAVDSPSVNFTTTSADGQATSIPTAAVATAEVEVQTQSTSASGTDSGEQPAEGESVAPAADKDEGQQVVAVAVVAPEQEREAASAEPAEEAAEAAQRLAAEAEASEQAASDPSRRALTAGHGGGSSAAQQVTAADVVAQQEAPQEAAEAEPAAAEPADAAASSGAEQSQPESAAMETPAPADDDHQAGAAASQTATSQTERRSVATAVARVESDWPLEQRPRSAIVRLASDPSWERPVQLVLAAIAITATVLWLVLTIVDRRRRA